MISIIVATSKNRVIGNNNSLIWKLPADLKRFKQITTDNTIVMGRKTYESIGKPLPNRRNIIITRDTNYLVDNCEVVNSLEEALMLCNNECFIIGGGEIYKQSIDISDKIYLTLVQEDFEGDEKNAHKYSFIDYERYKF